MISTFNVYYNLIDTNYHIIAIYTVEWVYTANQLLATPPWTPEYMCGTSWVLHSDVSLLFIWGLFEGEKQYMKKNYEQGLLHPLYLFFPVS